VVPLLKRPLDEAASRRCILLGDELATLPPGPADICCSYGALCSRLLGVRQSRENAGFPFSRGGLSSGVPKRARCGLHGSCGSVWARFPRLAREAAILASRRTDSGLSCYISNYARGARDVALEATVQPCNG
jgi:hypothetical protein